jgi:hypothetical protein
MAFDRIIWFGDSWTEDVSSDITPFPKSVTNSLGLGYVNFGKGGFSYNQIEQRFIEKYNSNFFTEQDVIVFCLTSSYRQRLPHKDGAINLEWRNIIDNHKQLVVELANDEFCSFMAFKTINLIYFMCRAKNLTCYFVNAFYPLTNVGKHLTPEDVWLKPYTSTLADSLFDVFDPEPAINDTPRFSIEKWVNHKKKIDQFLKPDDSHPNQLGNDIIAKELTDILQSRLYVTR